MRVRAPARLHLGFLDLHGGLGRRFGSIGLALDAPVLDLELAAAATLSVEGADAERVRAAIEAAAAYLHVPSAVAVTIRSTIPSHAGFGSGTQLALATAAGLARLYRNALAPAQAAAALERGNRSGIGLAAFVEGGLIVDGGRGKTDAPPPVIARLPFPEEWRVVLALDECMQGVHGASETSAFRELPPFPEADAAHLCRLTLMQILPAVAEADLGAFGRGIAELQRRVGDFFAPLQGGRFASPAVAAALRRIEELGIAGVGQSSWGPTGFAIVGSQGEAERLVHELGAAGSAGRLKYLIARGRNEGAEISIEKAEPRGAEAGSRRA